eukprot:7351237-Lingulodinium_polyedra.AAC.1
MCYAGRVGCEWSIICGGRSSETLAERALITQVLCGAQAFLAYALSQGSARETFFNWSWTL